MIIIGSARSDENNKLVNGAAGDQKQKSSTNDKIGEVSMQNFYVHSKGWYILRAKDVKIANKLASAMKDACNNPYIGYDQNQRTGIITQLKKYGSIAKIKTKTETDCSETVRACCIEAGFDPGDFNTASEVSVLSKTGKFMDKISYTSSTAIYNGDILVTKTKGHTVIVVEGNPRKTDNGTKNTTKKSDKKIPTLASPVIKKGDKGTQVKYLQQDLNYCGCSLTVDGVAGDKTITALILWQKKNGLAVDGIYGVKSRDKMKTLLK